MKIEVSGKGGSGKSTLSVLIARALSKRGFRVLLVDGDESNVGLENLVGVSPPVHLLEYLGGKKGFKEKLNQQMMMDNPAGIFSGKQRIKDIPRECIAPSEGVDLLIIGKIHHFGEGCACPIGILSKKFLSSIDMDKNEIIIMDTEAGVEHFGRGIVGECDLILGVIDPTAESFHLARKMEAMAAKAGKDLYFILNKVDPSIEPVMRRHLDEKKIIGTIPKDDLIFMESLEGRKLTKTMTEIDKICGRIVGIF
jgi:CO dehydrogenase maturation factor